MSMPVIQGAAKVKKPHKPFPTVVALIVGGAVALICAGVLGLGMLNGRESLRRAQTSNRLKQIMLALHSYHDQYDSLPPAVVTDANGKPLYSGRVLLLPFLEEAALFQKFDKTQAWNSPTNQPLSQRAVAVFQSPKHRTNSGNCDFLFVSGTGTAFDGEKSIRLGEVTDGLSTTVFVLESRQGPGSWAEPVDWTAGPLQPGFHGNSTYVGFGDGTVRPLTTKPPHPHSLPLCTIAGGETIPQSAFVSD